MSKPIALLDAGMVLAAYRMCKRRTGRDNILEIGDKKYNVSQTFKIFAAKGTKCRVCGIEGTHFEVFHNLGKNRLRLATHIPGVTLNVDHTVPKCIGGRNTVQNLEPLCTKCNGGWKSPIDVKLKGMFMGLSLDGNDYLMKVG